MECSRQDCGNEAVKYGKFCSRSCAASHNNLGVNRFEKRRKEKKRCRFCAEEVKTRNNVYCNQRCAADHVKAKTLAKWQNGEDDGVRGSGLYTAHFIRQWVKERDANTCQICGLTSWRGKEAPLILDHISGNSLDNSPGNLRMVCANCDMQLPTYKALNKGNGREERRKRYREGKSF